MTILRTFAKRSIVVLLVIALGGLPSLAQAQSTQTSPTTTTPQQPAPAPQDTQTAPAPEQTTTPAQDAQQAPPATQTPTPSDTPGSETYDPSKGPLQPAPTQTQEVPDAPSAVQPVPAEEPATVTPAPATSQTQQTPAQRTEPVGTAAAEKATTVGGAASKPAGAAIAPAKQKQSRSWLIKVGALAGAGVALGLVYGLSRSSPSTPPGSR